LERVTGSLAYGAIARGVWVATVNKSGDPERMFIQIKNNLAPIADGYGYSIVGGPLADDPTIIASRVVWGMRIEGSARDLLAAAESDGPTESGEAAGQGAQAFLKAALSAGPRRQKDVAAEGATKGFSSDRLFRASRAMGIVKRKEGFGGEWTWSLPSLSPVF
jgi:putative DNA primase/helicase